MDRQRRSQFPQCAVAARALAFEPGVNQRCEEVLAYDDFVEVRCAPVREVGPADWERPRREPTRVGGIAENATLQFRAEFFNFFNHPQFSNPAVNVNQPSSFGQLTGLSVNPRLIQFALKYVF